MKVTVSKLAPLGHHVTKEDRKEKAIKIAVSHPGRDGKVCTCGNHPSVGAK